MEHNKHSIEIKKSHKGRFTKWSKAHGMTVAEAAKKVMSHATDYGKHVVAMANFAKNIGHKHAYGGEVPFDRHSYGGNIMAFGGNVTSVSQSVTNSAKSLIKRPKMFAMGGQQIQNQGQAPVEVEGDEVAQSPNGDMTQFTGPSHEEGGINTTVPRGTDIYSDRLSIDGKTMAERKIARERSMNKLKKQLDNRPTDALIKNSVKRTAQTTAQEEQQDMLLQQLASKILPQPQQTGKAKAAYGKYAFGADGNDGSSDAFGSLDNSGNIIGGQGLNASGDIFQAPIAPTVLPNTPTFNNLNGSTFKDRPIGQGLDNSTNIFGNQQQSGISYPRQRDNIDNVDLSQSTPFTNPTTNNNIPDSYKTTIDQMPSFGADTNAVASVKAPITAGNIAGIIGTGVNTVSGLINTKKYWNNRVKNTNTFLGFNHDALATNQKALDNLQGEKQNLITDNIQTRNNAFNRNNNVRSINTRNALNNEADNVFNSSNTKVSDIMAQQTNQLLGQRATLQTGKDNAIMSGNKLVQQEDKADLENYYTQHGKDLTNLGTGLQQTGKNLNTQKQQDDFLSLLPSLSKYGLGISYVNGKPTLVNSNQVAQ